MCLNFYRPVEVSGLLILDDDDEDDEAAAGGAAGEGGEGGKVLSACAAAAAGDVEKSSDSAFSRYTGSTQTIQPSPAGYSRAASDLLRWLPVPPDHGGQDYEVR